MTCTFIETFIPQHAHEFFDRPDLREQVAEHLKTCQDCRKHVREKGAAIFAKASDKDITDVARITANDIKTDWGKK
jgi:predicted anti-sigma-YlaC factor YlaD